MKKQTTADRSWEIIKEFYKETFGISGSLVDYMSIKDILLMCASGSSNESISKYLEINREYIPAILSSVFGFKGWSRDLELNPYSVYNYLLSRKEASVGKFAEEVMSLDESISLKDAKFMFGICRKYRGIEDRLEKKWI